MEKVIVKFNLLMFQSKTIHNLLRHLHQLGMINMYCQKLDFNSQNQILRTSPVTIFFIFVSVQLKCVCELNWSFKISFNLVHIYNYKCKWYKWKLSKYLNHLFPFQYLFKALNRKKKKSCLYLIILLDTKWRNNKMEENKI